MISVLSSFNSSSCWFISSLTGHPQEQGEEEEEKGHPVISTDVAAVRHRFQTRGKGIWCATVVKLRHVETCSVAQRSQSSL